MKFKFSVKFYLEKRKDKANDQLIVDNVPIIMFFSFDGKRLQYFTGYRIDQGKWNSEDQRVKRNNINKDGISSTEINEHLDDLRNKIVEIYKEKKILKGTPSVQHIRDELRNRLGELGTQKKSFFEILEEFIESESSAKSWSISTKKKFRSIYNHLKSFQDSTRQRVDFDEIDETFLNKYVVYERDSLDHRNSYITKNIKTLKWFLNWATKKGYNNNLQYKDFDTKLKGTGSKTNIIFLTWEELMELYQLLIPKKYLEQVRDVFCFCCFTGLRYSDVYNLKHSNVKNGSIEITTWKTDDPLIIELNDYSQAILEKYKDTPFKKDKCLPVISNQKMNQYLKEIGRLADLNEPYTKVYYKGATRIEETFQKWELLTTHVGRKTFISNALFFNIPAEVIRSWTGHKDGRVMENYYKIIAPHKRREMDKFNKIPDE